MASGLVGAITSRAATSCSNVSSIKGDEMPLSVLELEGVLSPKPRTVNRRD